MQTTVRSKDAHVSAKPPQPCDDSGLDQTAPPKSEEYNPYLAARQEWDERYGDLVARAKKATRMALVCAVIALISTVGMVAMAMRPTKVIVVAVDSQGQYLASGASGRSVVITPDMKRATLAEWVTNLRLVTPDGISERAAIDRVYSMISSGSSAQTVISDFYRAKPPQTRARTETVHAEINSVLCPSGSTCQVEWLETTRDLQGKTLSQQRLKGAFTFVVSANPPTDEHLLRLNPIGLYITEATWSEILVTGGM